MSPFLDLSSSPGKWACLVAGISMFGLMLLSEHFEIYQYFWAATISFTAISFAIWENRSYHKEAWFWISLIVVIAFHIFLVQIVAEKKWLTEGIHGYNAKGLAMVALVDGAIITGIIRFPDWIINSYEWFFGDNFHESSERKAK